MKILLFKNKGVINSLIKWQTRSIYSHAAVLVDETRGEVIESYPGYGVRRRLIYPAKESIDVFHVFSDFNQDRLIIEFLEAQLGKHYDYWAIVRFIDRVNMPDNDKWFCSELVFAAFQYGGINLLERIKDYQVSPELLAISTLLFEPDVFVIPTPK